MNNINVVLKMKCEDCGHIQTVKGFKHNSAYYFGSAYSFCDKCEGLPIAIEEPQETPEPPKILAEPFTHNSGFFHTHNKKE